MANITNYKCPACTGPLHYAGASGMLECDYCGSKYKIEDMNKLYSDKVKEEADKNAAEEAEKAEAEEEVQSSVTGEFTAPETKDWDSSIGMKSFNCPSCGAELICEPTTVASSCPYCGNPTIIASQFKGGKMPDFVIPFKIDKKGAIAGLKNYYKGKKFLPNVFSAQNHIEEIKGVYVPFWLYSGNIDADVDMEASTSSSHRSGDKETTTTKYYDVKRSGNVTYNKIPVDASVKMDDAQMDSIEPYDYADLKEFSSSYLPGYLAESFDVSPEECFERCKLRAENSAVNAIVNSVSGYDSVSVKSKNLVIHNEKTSYAFLPVWLLSTKWNDQNYLFAMNGQTGKFIGDLPIDKGKVRLFMLKRAIIWTVILTVLFAIFI